VEVPDSHQVSLPVFAIPVTWTLDGVVFDDGGAASGSFIYDASTDIYSSIDIITTTGTRMPGAHYQYATFFLGSSGNVVGLTDINGPDLSGAAAWFMEFAGGLTNLGGNVSLVSTFGGESFCEDPDCAISVGSPQFRGVTAGTASAVPIPAAVWLFGSALAGLGWLRRKQAV
jgi:hypothetical protein